MANVYSVKECSSQSELNSDEWQSRVVDKAHLVHALMSKNENLPVRKDHFTWGQQLNGVILNSIHIQELGDIQVPITIKDVEKLKSISQMAPYGKGLNIVIDTNMKKTWQIQASKICSVSPEDFFQTTFAEMISNAIINLHLGWLFENCNDEIAEVEAHLHELLLYDTGGHYKRHCNFAIEQGIFAVMVLQIPVENGYRGGRLKVEDQSMTRHYEFDRDSDRYFFLAVFRSTCEHELEAIKSGWRVTLVINLVWKNAMDVTKIPLPLGNVLDLLTEVRKSLDPWFWNSSQTTKSDETSRLHMENMGSCCGTKGNSAEFISTDSSLQSGTCSEHNQMMFNPSSHPQTALQQKQIATSCKNSSDMLVFLLEHEYTLSDLSFFGLKGQDLSLARLFSCSSFLDVHLAIMTQQKDDKNIGLLEHWINSSNILIPFKGIRINVRDQLIREFQKTHRKFIQEDDHTSDFVDKPSRQAVLVIWPVHRSFRMHCFYAFDTLLDQLELQFQTSTHQKTIQTLRQILSFCRAEPLTVFDDSTAIRGERTSRLLQICVSLRARQEGLNLLELLGMDFVNPDKCRKGKEIIYEGVQSHQVAQLIAEFECRVSGWVACSSLILKMISPIRLTNQLTFIMSLARQLQNRCCTEGALKILDYVTSVLPKLDNFSLSCLSQSDIDSYVFFVIECEADPKTANSHRLGCFINLFPRLDSYQQCRLIVDLRRRIRFGGVPSCMHFYQQMCKALPPCDLHAPGPIKDVIVPVLSNFFHLGDPELIELLTDKICRGNLTAQENVLIEVLLASGEFWELATSSDLGKTMLASLIEAQVFSFTSMLDQVLAPRPLNSTQEAEFVDWTKKIRLLERLSELELESNEQKELIRNARITLTAAWMELLCQLADRQTNVEPNPNDILQVNITTFLMLFIQTEKSHYAINQQWIKMSFSSLFSKISMERLSQLILELYKIESTAPTDCKMIPSCTSLHQELYRQFVAGDITSMLASSKRLLVKVTKCLFWLGDEESLQTFTQKICSSTLLEEENLLVETIVTSNNLWPLAISSPHSLASFYSLLDRHIDYLKTVRRPVFSFEQPRAELPTHPEVQDFLRSAKESMVYHGLSSIFHARTFAEDLTKICLKEEWGSVKVLAKGSARKAYCEITKTRDFHRLKKIQYQTVQKKLSKMMTLRQFFEMKAAESEDSSKRIVELTEDSIILPSSSFQSGQEPEVIDISD